VLLSQWVNRIDKLTGRVLKFYLETSSNNQGQNQSNGLSVLNGQLFATFLGEVYTLPIQKTYSKLGKKFHQVYIPELQNSNVMAFQTNPDKTVLYFINAQGLFDYRSRVLHKANGIEAGLRFSFT
jgi:hypothetical protein